MSAGALTSLLLIPFTGGLNILHVGLATLGGLFPDFDHPRSTVAHMGFRLGKKGLIIKPFAPLAALGSLFFKHRTYTHTIPFALICSGVVWGISFYFDSSTPFFNALAFFLGYLSHIFTDAMTISGVPFLWPLKPITHNQHILGGRIRTGSTTDQILGIIFSLLFISVFFWMFITERFIIPGEI